MDLAHEPALKLGAMAVRPSTREIVFAGGREVVEPRVMGVLVTLAKAGGEVVTRDELIEACWEGRIVSDDAINRVISRIRRLSALTGGKDFTLETITKVGYRLVAGAGAAVVAETAAGDAPVTGVAAGRKLTGRMRAGLIAAGLALLVAVGVGGWQLMQRETPEAAAVEQARTLTLAVLPFDSLSPAGGDAALAVGMAREIRNTLSRVRGLRVVSDASSFAVAAEPLSATDMGARLGADLLLDGSFSQQGDTVKLTAELIDGRSGVNLWTGSQEGAAAILDHLRVLMASAIFEQLVARIGPNRLEMTAPPREGDPRIYALMVQAGELLEQGQQLRRHGETEAALTAGDKAYDLVQRALEIQPDSANALAMLGMLTVTSATHAMWTSGQPLADRMNEGADYARRALAIDPDNVRALQQLGAYYQRDAWRFSDAQPLFERAVAIDPNDFNTRVFFSFHLSTTGRCVDALEQAKVALALDPENRERNILLPRMLKCTGKVAEAEKAYWALADVDRGNLFLLTEIYHFALVKGDAPALRRMAAHVRDDLWAGAPSPPVAALVTRVSLAADAIDGRPEAYRAFLAADLAAFDVEQAKAQPSVQGRRSSDTMWTYAMEFAVAGETSRAIDLLQRAISAGSLYIPETMPYGAYEFTPAMRADPRYQAIWKNDPRLVELKRLRLESLNAGKLYGVAPDGRVVTPKE